MSDPLNRSTGPLPGPETRVRIVLVGTQHPGNIGAAARAMKTMGLSRLALVAPEKPLDDVAYRRSAGAEDVLGQAPVFATLAEAVADCRLVLGCTARSRRVQLEQLEPDQAAGRLLQAATDGEVALVFGRERTGLSNEELQLCHASVHIPSDPAFSSLNLAAAVQVLAYEVRLAALLDAPAPSLPAPPLPDELPAEPAARTSSQARPASAAGAGGAAGRPRPARRFLRATGPDPGGNRLPQGAGTGVGDAQVAPAVPAQRV